MNRTAVIVNPRAGRGKALSRWAGVRSSVERSVGSMETLFTERSGDGSEMARELLGRGFTRIVAAGGDGTINEVANGFFARGKLLNPAAALGILPLGTGADLPRSLGIPPNHEAVATLARGTPLPIDTGEVTFQDGAGGERTRLFLNMASFGLGGEVALRLRRSSLPVGRAARYLLSAVAALAHFRSPQVSLCLDGQRQEGPRAILHVAVGNGRFQGGGMQLCPQAVVNDGLLDITVIGPLGLLDALRHVPLLYSGGLYRHPKVRRLRGSTLSASAAEAVRLEIDGEPLGTLPAEFRMLSQRLPVLVPPGSSLLAAMP